MSARRSPIFNPENPTIPAGAVRRGPPIVPAVVREVVIRSSSDVPIVYDNDDDGELAATELFNPLAASNGRRALVRNLGISTEVMPAAFGAEMRDAVMASMKEVEAQRIARSPVRTSKIIRPAAAAPFEILGLTRFEITFAVCAAVVVGLTAAMLFVYFNGP